MMPTLKNRFGLIQRSHAPDYRSFNCYPNRHFCSSPCLRPHACAALVRAIPRRPTMQHAQHVSFGRFDTTARTAAGPAGTCTRQRTRPFSLAGQRQSRQRGQRQRQREKQQSRSSSGHHGIALASRRRQHTGRGAALTRRRFASSVACSKQLHGGEGLGS